MTTGVQAQQVLITCPCGTLPLEQAQQPDAQTAWNVAAAHVSLNPTLCQPSMTRVDVPVALAKAVPA